MIRAPGPVVMTCVLLVVSASACGEDQGHGSSSTASSTTEAPCPDVPVIVASKDIVAGTTSAEAMANGMLRETEMPAEYRPATAITSLDQLGEGVLIVDLAENEVVSFEHFGLPTETTLAPAGPGCSTDSPTTTAGT